MNEGIKVKDGITRNSPLLQFTRYASRKIKRGLTQNKYDPFKSPPDFQMAINHGIARRVCIDAQAQEDQDEVSFIQNQVHDDDMKDDEKSVEIQDVKSEKEFFNPISSLNLQPQIKDTNYDQMVKEAMCPCCGYVIQNQQFPLSVDPSKLSHLGVTYTLYFQFVKKCFMLILIQFLMSGSYSLIQNGLGSNCANQQRESFICSTSVTNILNQRKLTLLHIQSFANFMTVLVLIVVIEMFKINQEIYRYTIEKHLITPADYTIEIKGFPQDPTLDQIEKFVYSILKIDVHINQYIMVQKKEQPEICKIYSLIDMKPYTQLYQIKMGYHKKRNDLLAIQRIEQASSESKHLSELRIQIDQIDSLIIEIDKSIQEFEREIQLSTFRQHSLSLVDDPNTLRYESVYGQDYQLKCSGRMLVTLNRSKHAKMITEAYKMSACENLWYYFYKIGLCKRKARSKISKFFYQERMIKIIRASEPSDIIWSNIGSQESRFKMRILLNMSVGSIFLINLGLLIIIKRYLNSNLTVYPSQAWSILLSFSASTVVALTNTLIGIIIRKFAGLETHKRYTDYYISVGESLSYLYFINMVVATLGSNLLSIQNIQDQVGFPFKIEGLMYDFFFLFITNSYLSSLFNYFDIMWGYRLLKRRWYLDQKQSCALSQQEANQLFEGHPADMALRYANVLKLMFFSAVVSPLLPIGLIMSMIGLVILYWVDKYLLLRRYICPHYLNSQLADVMMENLSLYTVFLSFGNILIMFIPVLKDQTLIAFEWPDFYNNTFFYLALFGFLLAVCYRYVVQLRVIKDFYFFLFSIRIPKKKIIYTYQEQRRYFRQDYENFHPILREYYLPGGDVKPDQNDGIVAPDLFREIRQRVQ